MKEAIRQHSAYIYEEIQTLQREAKERLAEFGITVGAVLKRDLDGAVFTITRIGDLDYKCGCYLYGLKLRGDGTYGTHEHSIAFADAVTVVNQSKDS